MRRTSILVSATLVAAVPWATTAFAADHHVQILSKSPEGVVVQLESARLKVTPSDTMTFMPNDKGRNSESILAIAPQSADAWKGKIHEQITVTFAQKGIYGFKCQPHFGLGMVGLIQVGASTASLDATQTARLPGKNKTRMAEAVALLATTSTN